MWEANKKYTASIEGYGLSETKTGTPYVWVSFIAADCDGPLSWRGWLTSKAKLNTYKNLMKMGWNEDLQTLAMGEASKALDTDKDFEVETQLEEWTTQDGTPKSKLTIKWVNDPAQQAGGKMAAEKLFLLNQSLKGDLALLKQQEKQERRLPPQSQAEPKAVAAKTGTEDDLPF